MSARFTPNENPDEPSSTYSVWLTSACWRPADRMQDTAKVIRDGSSNACRETVARLRSQHGQEPEFTIVVEILEMSVTWEQGKRVVRCTGRKDQAVRSEIVRNPEWISR